MGKGELRTNRQLLSRSFSQQPATIAVNGEPLIEPIDRVHKQIAALWMRYNLD